MCLINPLLKLGPAFNVSRLFVDIIETNYELLEEISLLFVIERIRKKKKKIDKHRVVQFDLTKVPLNDLHIYIYIHIKRK